MPSFHSNLNLRVCDIYWFTSGKTQQPLAKETQQEAHSIIQHTNSLTVQIKMARWTKADDAKMIILWMMMKTMLR
jgi:hypothetical protein